MAGTRAERRIWSFGGDMELIHVLAEESEWAEDFSRRILRQRQPLPPNSQKS